MNNVYFFLKKNKLKKEKNNNNNNNNKTLFYRAPFPMGAKALFTKSKLEIV